jgi:hypothetical protein
MLTRRRFALGLAVAVLVFFVYVLGPKLKKDHERTERYRDGIRKLREQYPFESLETRIPGPPQSKRGHSLSQTSAEQLRKFESSIASETEGWGREQSLQKLHEGSVEEFVNREGFGVARMLGLK